MRPGANHAGVAALFARHGAQLCLLIGLAFVLAANARPAFAAAPDHAAWDRLLKVYVKPGRDGVNRVNYAAFKSRGHQALKAYLASLQSADPTKLGRNDRFAYYVNLYNAKTIDIVLDHYPVSSIKKISLGGGLFASGPWKAKVVKVKGRALSLDDIEHGILRKQFKDPRVHYAVNCASIGCPNLPKEAFTGAMLNAQLDASARAYVNNPRGFRFVGAKLTASSIYDWFQEDFGGTERGVIQHARKYAKPELTAMLSKAASINRFTYDWSLNDTR